MAMHSVNMGKSYLSSPETLQGEPPQMCYLEDSLKAERRQSEPEAQGELICFPHLGLRC